MSVLVHKSVATTLWSVLEREKPPVLEYAELTLGFRELFYVCRRIATWMISRSGLHSDSLQFQPANAPLRFKEGDSQAKSLQFLLASWKELDQLVLFANRSLDYRPGVTREQIEFLAGHLVENNEFSAEE